MSWTSRAQRIVYRHRYGEDYNISAAFKVPKASVATIKLRTTRQEQCHSWQSGETGKCPNVTANKLPKWTPCLSSCPLLALWQCHFHFLTLLKGIRCTSPFIILLCNSASHQKSFGPNPLRTEPLHWRNLDRLTFWTPSLWPRCHRCRCPSGRLWKKLLVPQDPCSGRPWLC